MTIDVRLRSPDCVGCSRIKVRGFLPDKQLRLTPNEAFNPPFNGVLVCSRCDFTPGATGGPPNAERAGDMP